MFLTGSIPSTSSSPMIFSGLFNGMLEVFEPGALNYYTLSSLILLILSISRNPTLTHLPLSGFLDSMVGSRITLTPSVALVLLMTRSLVAASSFSSGRA